MSQSFSIFCLTSVNSDFVRQSTAYVALIRRLPVNVGRFSGSNLDHVAKTSQSPPFQPGTETKKEWVGTRR